MIFNYILFLFIFQEIVPPAIITNSVSKLCSTLNLTDCSIACNTGTLYSSITKDQRRTNENKSGTKSLHKTHHENKDLPAGFKQKTKEILLTKVKVLKTCFKILIFTYLKNYVMYLFYVYKL